MIFTLSKIGNAGTRFGWAIVKDQIVFDRMFEYMWGATQGVSSDVQLKAFNVIDYHLQTRGV
jgi:U3 small nucleolar RNA-associated protein 4